MIVEQEYVATMDDVGVLLAEGSAQSLGLLSEAVVEAVIGETSELAFNHEEKCRACGKCAIANLISERKKSKQ